MQRHLTLVIAALVSACGPPDASDGEPLWQATHANRTVSLFGTVHSLSLEQARETYPRALAAFDSSSTLYIETDTEAVDPGLYALLARRTSDQPDLDSELTVTEWRTLVDATKHLVPETAMRRAEYWYASLVYSTAILPASGPSMDLELVKEARQRGVEVRFLERWDSAVFALHDSTTIEVLKATLATSPEELATTRRALENAWLTKKLSVLSASIAKSSALQKQHLFDERNLAWTVSLADDLKNVSGPVFVAVGAGHLVFSDAQTDSFPDKLRLFDVAVSRVP